jgi:hypothetical protein
MIQNYFLPFSSHRKSLIFHLGTLVALVMMVATTVVMGEVSFTTMKTMEVMVVAVQRWCCGSGNDNDSSDSDINNNSGNISGSDGSNV